VESAGLARYEVPTMSNSGGEEDDEVYAFTIICGDNMVVRVSDDEAKILMQKCEYFCNVFSHNTKESDTRTIGKPDWTSETARLVINYLINDTVEVATNNLQELTMALDQLLVYEYRTVNFMRVDQMRNYLYGDGYKNMQRIRSRFENSIQSPWGLQFRPGISSGMWHHLYYQSIMLGGQSLYLSVLYKTGDSSSSGSSIGDKCTIDLAEKKPGQGVGPLYVYSLSRKDAADSILEVIRSLCKLSFYQQFRYLGQSKQVIELHINREVTGADLQSLKDDLLIRSGCVCSSIEKLQSISCEDIDHGFCMTLSGTFQQLYDGLSVIDEDMIEAYKCRSNDNLIYKRGLLIVCTPTSTTTALLVEACGTCIDDPNTLGFNVPSESIVALKSVSDIKLMLQYMCHHSEAQDSTLEKPFVFTEEFNPYMKVYEARMRRYYAIMDCRPDVQW
jgi:BTB/POZ domain